MQEEQPFDETLTPDLCAERLRATLRLMHVSGVGPVIFRRLVRVFGSPEAAIAAPAERLLELPELSQTLVRAIKASMQNPWAEQELQRASEHGFRLIVLGDPAYPRLLLNTYNPPPVLYVQGELLPTDGLAVAIVGSRQCSPYGRKQAEQLSAGLALAGFTVVSGLARGIDTAAHQGALSQGGGRTLACLGNGLRQIYPPENAKLAERIVSGNGALISEFPIDTPPASDHFPRRNRIIAGLSLGVIVVEGSERSGALITARYAIDMDREIFAVPGSVENLNARGPHRLIKQGAKLVEDVEDILLELKEIAAPLVRLPKPDARIRTASKREPASPTLFESLDKPANDRAAGTSASRPSTTDLRAANLNAREKTLFALLDENEAYSVDALIEKSGLQPQEVLSTLLVLEVRRLCKQLPGKRYLKA